MRILFISDVYFPRINGVSTSMQTFSRELRRLGHHITLVVPDYGQGSPAEAGVLRIPSRGVWLDPEDRMMHYRALTDLEERLRGENHDLIHIHTPFVAHYAGLRLARRLKLPRVETYHTFFEEYLYHYVPFLPRGTLRYAARRLARTQCNAVDALVVPSAAMAEVLKDYGVTTPMEILPTGIELERFTGGDGARFRAAHGIAPQRPVLLHVGRVAFEKNIVFLLRVLCRVRLELPEALLIIAGEGPAIHALRREALALGVFDNILFVGNMDRTTALLDCYRAADVKLFASRTETQGLVLLEAMALGVPVVSTAVMGTRDVLRRGCGALVAEEDEAQFAAAVLRVLRNPALAQELGAAGREYVKYWSAPVLARRMETLYSRLVSAQGVGVDSPLGASARRRKNLQG